MAKIVSKNRYIKLDPVRYTIEVMIDKQPAHNRLTKRISQLHTNAIS